MAGSFRAPPATALRYVLDLRPLFSSLAPPPGPAPSGQILLSATAVPGRGNFRVARDSGGRAILLLESTGAGPTVETVPIVLQNLRLEHARSCRVYHGDGHVETGAFTIATCLAQDLGLRDHFLLISGLLVESLSSEPSGKEMGDAYRNLVELFRSLTAPPRKSVQGLWGEVFLIARAAAPASLIRSWHSTPGDRYDFSSGQERIEVKSVAGQRREHHFTHEQVHPPAGTEVLVASVVVQRAGDGESLSDLVGQVRLRLGDRPDLLLRIELIIAATLGSHLEVGLGERYDREAAEDSLEFYPIDRVPQFPELLPAGVSDVRFRADLDRAYPVHVENYAKRGLDSLFGAAARGARGR